MSAIQPLFRRINSDIGLENKNIRETCNNISSQKHQIRFAGLLADSSNFGPLKNWMAPIQTVVSQKELLRKTQVKILNVQPQPKSIAWKLRKGKSRGLNKIHTRRVL